MVRLTSAVKWDTNAQGRWLINGNKFDVASSFSPGANVEAESLSPAQQGFGLLVKHFRCCELGTVILPHLLPPRSNSCAVLRRTVSELSGQRMAGAGRIVPHDWR